MGSLDVPEGLDHQAILEWAGGDVERLHQAWQLEAVDKPPGQRRAELVHALEDRLGWPAPNTPPATVLAWSGRPGFPPARLLAVERARPQRWQRPDLVRQLEDQVAAQGDNASTVAPTRPNFKSLFR